MTHQWEPKPLFFKENADRFSDFNIEHIVIDTYDGVDTSDSWSVENHQKEMCINGMFERVGISKGDTVIVSDLDEIPTGECCHGGGRTGLLDTGRSLHAHVFLSHELPHR